MLQRRRFIQSVGATGLAPLAAVLADPELAAAAAATLETVQTETPHGTVRPRSPVRRRARRRPSC